MRSLLEQKAIERGIPSLPNGSPLPNDVLRSALFAVTEKEYAKECKVASIGGIDVYIVRGYRLTQAHLDVWEQCLRLASQQGTGQRIVFSGYSFLRAIGRSTGKSDYKWLRGMLYDLAGCLVRITNGKRSFFGSLIRRGAIDEETDTFAIEIEKPLAVLFMDGWTALDQDTRKALRKRPLAQWLHAFYSTHEKPHRYKVETIRQLCGSDVRELRKFRQILRRALIALAEATGWKCWIDDEDCVVVEKQEVCRKAIGIAGTGETA